jgi:hypothetical protein
MKFRQLETSAPSSLDNTSEIERRSDIGERLVSLSVRADRITAAEMACADVLVGGEKANSSLSRITLGETSQKFVLQIHTIPTAEHSNVGLIAPFLIGGR